MNCVRCDREFVTTNEYYSLCSDCFEYIHKCLGTTKSGKHCSNYHKNVSGYCWRHQKGHEHELTHIETYALMAWRRDELNRQREARELEAYRGMIALPADNWLRALVEQE